MSEPKSPKPMPSAAEINAYLEQSAARTKLRLPLAKLGAPKAEAASGGGAAAAAAVQGKALPVQGKALPVQPTVEAPTPSEPGGAWTPFDDRK